MSYTSYTGCGQSHESVTITTVRLIISLEQHAAKSSYTTATLKKILFRKGRHVIQSILSISFQRMSSSWWKSTKQVSSFYHLHHNSYKQSLTAINTIIFFFSHLKVMREKKKNLSCNWEATTQCLDDFPTAKLKLQLSILQGFPTYILWIVE